MFNCVGPFRSDVVVIAYVIGTESHLNNTFFRLRDSVNCEWQLMIIIVVDNHNLDN